MQASLCFSFLLFVPHCLAKYRRMLHLTQHGDQGLCILCTCPGQHVLCLVICLFIGIPGHSQSGGPIVTPLSGTIKPPRDGPGVSPLWSVQLSLLLPSFLWFVRAGMWDNTGQYTGMLPRRLVSQQLLLCPLVVKSSPSIFLDLFSLFSPPHVQSRHGDSWCNVTCALMSGQCLISAGHITVTDADNKRWWWKNENGVFCKNKHCSGRERTGQISWPISFKLQILHCLHSPCAR